MFIKTELVNSLLNNSRALALLDSLELSEKPEMLFNSHQWEDNIVLRTVSNFAFNLVETSLRQSIVSIKCNMPACRDNFTG